MGAAGAEVRTLHVLILAGSILGAAWILKPPDPVSQVELQRREEQERWWQNSLASGRRDSCLKSMGKTIETLNRDDPAQEKAWTQCMWPEERGVIRRGWDYLRWFVWRATS